MHGCCIGLDFMGFSYRSLALPTPRGLPEDVTPSSSSSSSSCCCSCSSSFSLSPSLSLSLSL